MSAATPTEPWDRSVETLIRESLPHVYTVTFHNAAGLEIRGFNVTSCTVRLDEYWSPYLQATLTITLPPAGGLALLDPRLLVTVTISAGYVLADGLTDVHPIGIGYLARRTINQPDNQVTLEVAGPEYLVEEWRSLAQEWAFDGDELRATDWHDTTEARDAVRTCLDVCGAIDNYDDPRFDYYNAMDTTGWAPAPPDFWIPREGDPALPIARDIAGRIGGWFRCDELGKWRLTPRPVDDDNAQIVHYLRAGVDGTLINSDGTLSREGWANAVLVHYQWGSADNQQVLGSAWISSGPYAVDVVGTVVHSIESPNKASAAHADRRAASALKQLIGMGFAYSVEAVAAYWVRPTDVISLDLGVEDAQLAFVSSIAWDLDAGRMSITTRQPAPGTITSP